MNVFSNKLILSAAVAAILASASALGFAADAAPGITAARQESQISTTYMLSPYLRANDIQVTVLDGKATLSGTVEEEVNKVLASQIALGVEGIRSVDNQILVQADYVAPATKSGRSYAQQVDDASITAAVRSKLMWSRHADESTIEVATLAGQVKLEGRADHQQAKDLAGRLALNTPGVRGVDNQLVVAPAAADKMDAGTAATTQAGRDVADGWITTKVMSTFMYSNNVDGGDIAVSTKDGVVTLSGTVGSGAERALAIEFAQNVRGVTRVESSGLLLAPTPAVASAD